LNASMIPPDQFASLVTEATDEQLAEGMTTNRELILSEIFTRMPEQFDRAKAPDVTAVVEWQITDGPEGRTDRWQLTIKDGACTCAEGGDAEPDVTFTVAPVDFVKLIAGAESGPKMFVFGKLKIRGNLMLAARVQGFFRMPGASSPAA
jgi:putative sterol carrier protein